MTPPHLPAIYTPCPRQSTIPYVSHYSFYTFKPHTISRMKFSTTTLALFAALVSAEFDPSKPFGLQAIRSSSDIHYASLSVVNNGLYISNQGSFFQLKDGSIATASGQKLDFSKQGLVKTGDSGSTVKINPDYSVEIDGGKSIKACPYQVGKSVEVDSDCKDGTDFKLRAVQQDSGSGSDSGSASQSDSGSQSQTQSQSPQSSATGTSDSSGGSSGSGDSGTSPGGSGGSGAPSGGSSDGSSGSGSPSDSSSGSSPQSASSPQGSPSSSDSGTQGGSSGSGDSSSSTSDGSGGSSGGSGGFASVGSGNQGDSSGSGSGSGSTSGSDSGNQGNTGSGSTSNHPCAQCPGWNGQPPQSGGSGNQGNGGGNGGNGGSGNQGNGDTPPAQANSAHVKSTASGLVAVTLALSLLF